MATRWYVSTWQSILTFIPEWQTHSDGKIATAMICLESTHRALWQVAEVLAMVKLVPTLANCSVEWLC